jgi:hypothetical protein
MHTQQQYSNFVRAIKPSTMSPAAFAVMLVLMDESRDRPVWLSQETISARTGVGLRTVSKAVKELSVTLKWIKKHSGKRRFNSNLYEVLHANLPVYVPEESMDITDKAKELAKWFRDIYKEHFAEYTNKKGRRCRRKLRSDWEKRWAPVLQRQLNKLGFNVVAGILNDCVNSALNGDRRALHQFVSGPQGIAWPDKEGQ